MLPSVIRVAADGGGEKFCGGRNLLEEHVQPRLDGHFATTLFQNEIAETHGDGEVS